MSEREHHIKTLENLLSHYKEREKCEGYYDSTLKDNVDALSYAISSLKTDLKYDLMYEGKEVYTKADMVAMLEELKTKIEDKEKYYRAEFEEPSNLLHETAMCGRMFGYGGAKQIIQEKIDKLKKESK